MRGTRVFFKKKSANGTRNLGKVAPEAKTMGGREKKGNQPWNKKKKEEGTSSRRSREERSIGPNRRWGSHRLPKGPLITQAKGHRRSGGRRIPFGLERHIRHTQLKAEIEHIEGGKTLRIIDQPAKARAFPVSQV